MSKNYTIHVDGSKSFVDRGFGTSTHYTEISEEEYQKYAAMEHRELYEYVRDNVISDSIRWGYGYYGCDLYVDPEDGTKFLGVTSGNSCD